MDEPDVDNSQNLEVFQDCLSAVVIERLRKPAPKTRRRAKKTQAQRAAAAAVVARGAGAAVAASQHVVVVASDQQKRGGDAEISSSAPPAKSDATPSVPTRTASDGAARLSANTSLGGSGRAGVGPEDAPRKEAHPPTWTSDPRAADSSAASAEVVPATPLEQGDEDVPDDDAAELADFVAYLAEELFEALPEGLQALDHYGPDDGDGASERDRFRDLLPLAVDDVAGLLRWHVLDPAVAESLAAYGILEGGEGGGRPSSSSSSSSSSWPNRTAAVEPSAPAAEDLSSSLSTFLAPVLTSYITSCTTPPPPPSATRALATACEVCGRDWVPLTYHHLVPRSVHAKAVRRGWHRPADLQKVAWLCRACHSFVHRFRPNEDLARDYHEVDLLLRADEVRSWAAFAARLRWKAGGRTKYGRERALNCAG